MTKIGRNEPCPCGSGKKYKRCCMSSVGKQHADFVDSIGQMLAMNPDLSLDELNVIAEHQSNKNKIDNLKNEKPIHIITC